MEKIKHTYQMFDAKSAIQKTKIYKENYINELLYKIYNECIIPAIKKGNFTCSYEHKDVYYIPKEVIQTFVNKGFVVSNYNNIRLTIKWEE